MFRHYFEHFYSRSVLDKHDIAALLKPDGQSDDPLKVQFRTAAQRFQLIDESGYRSVIVRYGDSPSIDRPVTERRAGTLADAQAPTLHRVAAGVSIPETAKQRRCE